MNIYDQNYAIGAGFITQSEFDGIYNEFFTQCQITTGLILPLFILSVCIGIRRICCAPASPAGPGSWILLGGVFGAIYIGALSGVMLAWLIARVGSSGYSKGFTFHGFWESHRHLVVILALLLILPSVVLIAFLGFDAAPLIALPCVFIFPLWISGLDRLHLFYSQLQARIAGNILRQQESTEQKIVDLLSDKKSREQTIEQLKQKCELARKLEKLDCNEKQGPSSPTSAPLVPPTPPTSSPPQPASGPSGNQAADSQPTSGGNT
jgi:hypothetical protein